MRLFTGNLSPWESVVAMAPILKERRLILSQGGRGYRGAGSKPSLAYECHHVRSEKPERRQNNADNAERNAQPHEGCDAGDDCS